MSDLIEIAEHDLVNSVVCENFIKSVIWWFSEICFLTNVFFYWFGQYN